MKNPVTVCPHCKGTGQAQIPKALARTLALFTSQKRKWSASEMSQATKDDPKPISRTACNNRLEKLRSMGLLCRTRLTNSDSWQYMKGGGTSAQVLNRKKKKT